MARDLDLDLLDYYRHFCEMAIWLKKIVLHAKPHHYITVQDVTVEFIAERNKLLELVDERHRPLMRKKMNAIATSYYHKVSHWTRKQKITIDMV